MKIYIYICFLGMTFCLSCMEDKSNYDYVTLNQIQIDTIQDRTIALFDTLKVPTKVTCSMENTDFAYVWYRYEGLDGTKCDTLSLEKDLEYKVTDLVGEYQIYFKVIDVATGLSEKTTFKMKVVGKFDEGLMILGKMKEKTSLVFISQTGEVTELYGGETGELLGRNPVSIGNANFANVEGLRDIMVLCDDNKGGILLSSGDFTVSKAMEDVFYLKPEVFKPQAYYPAYNALASLGWADFIISDGKLHARTLYNKITTAFNPVFEGNYQLCPYALVCPPAYLFYDNSGNGRFLTIMQSMFKMDKTFSLLQSNSADFNPSDVGMECIYLSEATKWQNKYRTGYGIFKDKTTGQLQGLRFSLSAYSDEWSDSFTDKMSLYSKSAISSNAEGIAESPGYAMSIARPHLYYSKGSQVYFYGIDNDQCYPIYDVDTVGGLNNSVIDQVYMEYWTGYYYERDDVYGSVNDKYNKVLYVASHKEGEAGHQGTIHILKLADNGTVESRTALYKNICGETVSMCYKR